MTVLVGRSAACFGAGSSALKGWARRLPGVGVVPSALKAGMSSRHNSAPRTSAGSAIGAVGIPDAATDLRIGSGIDSDAERLTTHDSRLTINRARARARARARIRERIRKVPLTPAFCVGAACRRHKHSDARPARSEEGAGRAVTVLVWRSAACPGTGTQLSMTELGDCPVSELCRAHSRLGCRPGTTPHPARPPEAR